MTTLFSRRQTRSGLLPFWVKFCQGISALPGQHKDWAFNTLLLLYYSQVLGLPASYAAMVLALSLVIDAISDPMVGAFSDNFRCLFKLSPSALKTPSTPISRITLSILLRRLKS